MQQEQAKSDENSPRNRVHKLAGILRFQEHSTIYSYIISGWTIVLALFSEVIIATYIHTKKDNVQKFKRIN